jgi:urea transport system ATP-binding protein
MLKVRGLNHFYGGSHTLWDLDLDIEKGSCTCLMGRNGMGKTTLLKCIMGLLPLASGSIELEDRAMHLLPAHARARLRIGYVPQGREIFSQLTVGENLRVGLGARADNRKEIPAAIFELFPVLQKMLNRRGGDLSGGQQQQLAFARALVLEPTLLLLDEPTEGIQPNIVHEIGDVIIKLRSAGVTVLLVEQKLPFARRIATDFRILDKGRLVQSGPIAALSEVLVQKHLTV